jgi:hypothetical protein
MALIWERTNGLGRGQGDEAGVRECQCANYNHRHADVTNGMAPSEMQIETERRGAQGKFGVGENVRMQTHVFRGF